MNNLMETPLTFVDFNKNKPEDALRLPKGVLVVNGFNAEFTSQDVVSAANQIIFDLECEHGMHTPNDNLSKIFLTQSQIIAEAANHLFWKKNGASVGYITN